MSDRQNAVVVDGLRKRYGDEVALDGLSLTVRQGTVCGLLGPNGAGKTTAVRILATLLRLDEGYAEVGGFDVAKQANEVRYSIGFVGQNAAVDEVLSGYQNLVMFCRLFHLSRPEAQRRANELLDQFRLADARDKPVSAYSGGMKRRLDLAASMVLAPKVLFLDEPTVGLDPRARNEVWEAVREMADHGTSVLLTTQYLDEADRLASQIYVIDTGQVIAEGSPSQLKSRIGGDRIDVVVREPRDLDRAQLVLSRLTSAAPKINIDDRCISIQVSNPAGALQDVVRLFDADGIGLDDLAMRRPTLDDAFLQLTGRRSSRVELSQEVPA